ncbi:MAG: sulfatase-like hydrolase/transferase, partial [Rubripirellula sp.]
VVDFIDQHADEPFFLVFASPVPHLALQVPEESLEAYPDSMDNGPFLGGPYLPHPRPKAAYAAMITRLDRYVGNLLDLLDELKLSDNTLVVFTSDNGTTHLGLEVDFTFFKSVGELRGLKGSLYEGGVRVPTIVRWPGHVEPGTVSDRVSGFEDWLPTLMEAVGGAATVSDEIDGISLLATLKGQKQPEREYLYREFPSYGGQQTIRVGDWKAVRQNMSKGNLDIELYNIADDIGEKNNVAADNPAVVARLEKMMSEVRTPSKMFPLKPLDGPGK